MRIQKNKYIALSLTELLLVLVIVALLFAAMAPIITKRRTVQSYESESVWNFLPNDNDYSSYFDPGILAWSSSVYAGYEPTGTESNPGKFVINTGDVTYNSTPYPQYYFQFRYGTGRGLPAGVFMQNRDMNLSLGYAHGLGNSTRNTVAGNYALKKSFSNSSKNVAVGDSAMGNADISGVHSHMLAVGARAAENYGSGISGGAVAGDNVYIGSGAGATKYSPQANVAIGYNSMSNILSNSSNSVFVGSQTGDKGETSAKYNTVIGSSYMPSGGNNTVIGYNSFSKNTTEVSNITAIGYGACDSITSSHKGTNVCIGYNSAHVDNKSTPDSYKGGEHIFLGGAPLGDNGFGGRAVMEVHRTPLSSGDIRGTVILNSNLVVRGNFYSGDADIQNFNKLNVGYNDLITGYSFYQCKRDAYYPDFYDKNDIYSGFACNSNVAGDPFAVINSPSKNVLTQNEIIQMSASKPYPEFIQNSTSSDLRLKTNISPSDAGLNKILSLKPYYFTFKNDNEENLQVGVMAQDLQRVFPNSVFQDKNGYLKIRIDEMFYALINAVKTLNDKIVSLNKDLADLYSNAITIKKTHKNIKKRILVLNNRMKKLERTK